MDTAAMGPVFSGIGDSATKFHADWSSSTAAGAAGIGQGPMGAQFMAGFEAESQRLHKEAARIAGGIAQLAEAGRLAVQDYLAADARGGEAFPQG